MKAANITTADYRKMDEIAGAIYRYGQDTGYYPAALGNLTPDYLAEYPLTSDYREFVYDAQNGIASHPDQAPAPAVLNTQSPGAYGAAGQPIHNMNASGANAAGTRVRTDTGAIGGGYSNKQMKAVEELGF